jgi:hypothetical protein
LDLSSKGLSQADIARTLQVNESTISRDISSLNIQARNNIRKYIDERLPSEYEKCLVGLTSILKEAWITAAKAEDKREKLQALSLAKECYSMKLELLTNATVVDDAIRFVSDKSFVSEKSNNKNKSKSVIQPDDQDNENKQVLSNQVY